MATVRIVLAEDHKIMRQGLRMVLDREPDLEVVGEADDGGGRSGWCGSFGPMYWSWMFRCQASMA